MTQTCSIYKHPRQIRASKYHNAAFSFIILYPSMSYPRISSLKTVSKNTLTWNNRMTGITTIKTTQNCVWVNERWKLLSIFKSPLLNCLPSIVCYFRPFLYVTTRNSCQHPSSESNQITSRFWKSLGQTYPSCCLPTILLCVHLPYKSRTLNSLLEHCSH